ncbi:T9SS type A sorting domain-containing protein [Psychroserpens ponticola]|uniref:T9SS type A sorting domain-containing protein n=1 Tax=Psychroserpens ponticola TaxID=2932268 RepID=A0ABY7RWL1_9FLAO|nr:T9SS type A sorting domain-containing protein [Psychroserpens ponticola]WCO01383.1 T9SS type A sorting domain-containing protein [Psychroserpens ponticola]
MKNYLFIFLVFSIMSMPHIGHAQFIDTTKTSSTTIEELMIFPNPVIDGILNISSKHNLPKTIEIYDVLGKRIMAASILGKTFNISRLSPGVYILKIKENAISATRKLVVK